jgi:hypothetical protein
MPVFPPSVNVKDESSMKALADGFRAATYQGSDFLCTTAAYLHPLMVNTMVKYGLDGTNRFGFGSDANKAANKVTKLLKDAADHLTDAGRCVGYAYLAFVSDVWEPIQRAKQEQENHSTQTLNV